jgi:cytochrome b-561
MLLLFLYFVSVLVCSLSFCLFLSFFLRAAMSVPVDASGQPLYGGYQQPTQLYPANNNYQPTDMLHYSRPKSITLFSAVITHLVLCLAVFLTFLFVFNWPNPQEGAPWAFGFQWHPVLMVSAFVFFMGEAILSYRLLPFDYHTQKVIHLLLQTLALITGGIGIFFIIMFHQKTQTVHFYNPHSVTGIATYSLFVVQYLIGFYAFWFPRMADAPRAETMRYHKWIGVTLFFMTWLSMLTGLMDRVRIQDDFEHMRRFSPQYRMANAAGAFIVLAAICILYHFSPAAKTKEKVGGDLQDALLP